MKQAEQVFEFSNQAGDLVPVTREVLHYVTNMLPAANTDVLMFKLRYIVTELLTNGIKHSGVGKTLLSIAIDEHKLQLTKTDTGNPLNLLPPHGKKVVIYGDGIHQLYAASQNQTVKFICEELPPSQVYTDISEHFGLLIIAKAADEFTYSYQSPRNVFNVTIGL